MARILSNLPFQKTLEPLAVVGVPEILNKNLFRPIILVHLCRIFLASLVGVLAVLHVASKMKNRTNDLETMLQSFEFEKTDVIVLLVALFETTWFFSTTLVLLCCGYTSSVAQDQVVYLSKLRNYLRIQICMYSSGSAMMGALYFGVTQIPNLQVLILPTLIFEFIACLYVSVLHQIINDATELHHSYNNSNDV